MRRSLLRVGRAREARSRRACAGMTSNPTIFEKAIVSSGDYEEALRKLVAEGRSTIEIYEQLAIEDIRGACDLMLPAVRGERRRRRAHLARGAARAGDRHRQDRRRRGCGWPAEVGRPNVMIKVPATPEGIPAIRALTAHGRQRQRDADLLAAAVRGGARGVSGGARGPDRGGRHARRVWPPWRASSCRASTRPATSCSRTRPRRRRSWRRAARRCSASWRSPTPRWPTRSTSARSRRRAGRKLAAAGARPQRLLWASTGTKDPRYPDTYYVDALIGRRHRRHGAARDAGRLPRSRQARVAHLSDDLEGAKRAVAEFAAVGLDLSRVCHGAARRRREVVHHVDEDAARRRSAGGGRRCSSPRPAASGCRCPTALQRATDAAVAKLREGPRARARLGGATRRSSPPTPSHERSIKSRLGWLRAPALMRTQARRARGVRRRREGRRVHRRRAARHGRQLAVARGRCSRGLARRRRARRLHVLDNTDPAAVAAVDAR